MRLECRFIDAFPQLPRPEGARLNLPPGPLLSRPSSPPLPTSPPVSRLRCRLSGFSAPLTTLSRKYVNVHACPIIRSSRSLFSFVPLRSLDRLFPSPHVLACLSAPWSQRSIDPRARESRIHVVPRFELSRASGTRKRSIAQCFAPVVARRER